LVAVAASAAVNSCSAALSCCWLAAAEAGREAPTLVLPEVLLATALLETAFPEAGFAEEALVVEVLVVEVLTAAAFAAGGLRVRVTLLEATAGVSAVLGSAAALDFELALAAESFGLLREAFGFASTLTPAPEREATVRISWSGFLDLTAATGLIRTTEESRGGREKGGRKRRRGGFEVLLHGNDAPRLGKASVETLPVRQQIEIETGPSASQNTINQTKRQGSTRMPMQGCQGRSQTGRLDGG